MELINYGCDGANHQARAIPAALQWVVSDGHEEKLLDFIRDEFLGVPKDVFSSIMDQRMLTVDDDDPKSFFLNFWRLERFLTGLFGQGAYDLKKEAL